jgi:fructose-bisphosphate aldolase class 1
MNFVSATYTKEGSIVVTVEDQPPDTSITVPADEANKDYVALMKWVEEGNQITPYVEPEVQPAGSTLEERIAALKEQVEALSAALAEVRAT